MCGAEGCGWERTCCEKERRQEERRRGRGEIERYPTKTKTKTEGADEDRDEEKTQMKTRKQTTRPTNEEAGQLKEPSNYTTPCLLFPWEHLHNTRNAEPKRRWSRSSPRFLGAPAIPFSDGKDDVMLVALFLSTDSSNQQSMDSFMSCSLQKWQMSNACVVFVKTCLFSFAIGTRLPSVMPTGDSACTRGSRSALTITT